MLEPARRKRFQIHLSTALVMMIAAGILIWANVTSEAREIVARDYTYDQEGHAYPIPDPPWRTVRQYGWPLTALVLSEFHPLDHRAHEFAIASVAVDFLVFAVALIVTGLICELWIRIRSAQKEHEA